LVRPRAWFQPHVAARPRVRCEDHRAVPLELRPHPRTHPPTHADAARADTLLRPIPRHYPFLVTTLKTNPRTSIFDQAKATTALDYYQIRYNICPRCCPHRLFDRSACYLPNIPPSRLFYLSKFITDYYIFFHDLPHRLLPTCTHLSFPVLDISWTYPSSSRLHLDHLSLAQKDNTY